MIKPETCFSIWRGPRSWWHADLSAEGFYKCVKPGSLYTVVEFIFAPDLAPTLIQIQGCLLGIWIQQSVQKRIRTKGIIIRIVVNIYHNFNQEIFFFLHVSVLERI